MMKKIYLFIIVLFCTLSVVSAATDKNDAVYKKVLMEYTLNPDGSSDYHYSHELNLLTYLSSDRLYGETFIVYNPDFQKLKVNRSETRMPSGKMVKSPSNAYNEVLPAYAANAPFFNQLREMVVTHTGIGPGATLFEDYTIHTQKGMFNGLCGNDELAFTSPVEELTYIVRVPATKSIDSKILNIEGAFSVVKEGKWKVYRWIVKNIPAKTRESYQLSDKLGVPRIIFSTGEVWKPVLAQKAYLFQVNEKMKQELDKIKRENKNPLDQVLRIQESVVNDVAYAPVPFGVTGLRSRTAVECRESNYGNEAEKATLLTALLKAAGFKSDLVVMIPDEYLVKNVVNPLAISNFFVRTEVETGNSILFSPLAINDQDLAYSIGGKEVFVLDAKKMSVSAKPVAAGNSCLMNVDFRLSKEGALIGKIEAVVSGAANPWFMLERSKDFAGHLVNNSITGEDVKYVEIKQLTKQQSAFVLSVEKKDALIVSNDYCFLSLPQFNYKLTNWNMIDFPSERSEKLQLLAPVSELYRVQIEIPEGYELISPLQNKEIKNEVGEFSYVLKKNGNVIEVDKIIKIVNPDVNPGASYNSLRVLIQSWLDKNNKELILKKI
ncbi:MAG: DUF3857 domain-containing protein [Bacteroidota bacterium]|nr:DUF3857 domain-containing protein [Bacteroidota bacterium]